MVNFHIPMKINHYTDLAELRYIAKKGQKKSQITVRFYFNMLSHQHGHAQIIQEPLRYLHE